MSKSTTITANTIITSITPIFDQIEDRVILIMNYNDHNKRIDYMVTRDMIIKLIPTLDEYMYNHYPREMLEPNYTPQIEPPLSQYLKTNIPKDIDTNKNQLSTDMGDLELYKAVSKTDLLITLNLNYTQGSAKTKITFVGKEQNNSIFFSDFNLLKSVVQLIRNIIPYHNWCLSRDF